MTSQLFAQLHLESDAIIKIFFQYIFWLILFLT